ncbi:S16 family serine protease [Rubritalea spongiae]|uniref:S16 family serine protease n=1 Tax=Rubritalea spongiae TaxID=430797 RepID=A0ABW5E2I4_9BACT
MKKSFVCSCLLGIYVAVFSPTNSTAGEIGRKQAEVKGLLVMDLGNGKFAGTASQMNATAMSKTGVKNLELAFNQDVGAMMDQATREVVKFMNVRHADLPEGYRVEFAFADKYSPKDGPSAAVATALLLDSIITGKELNNDFAVTGDMNATGEVRPVGGVRAKVRGAAKRCKLVAIPEQNADAISDAYVLEGIPYLTAVQIFSIENFDQAYALAAEQSPETQQAITDFAAVQGALERNEKFVYNPKVREKLREVVEALPNHLSAHLLLRHSYNKGPKSLSLNGSISAIDTASFEFSKMLQNQSFLERGGENDVLAGYISDMRDLRKIVDNRVRNYCDSYMELAEYIKSVRLKRTWSQQNASEFAMKVNAIRAEREALIGNPEVQEELMMD